MNTLFSLYLSARANGVIASGIAASMIELERVDVDWPNSFIPKYKPAGKITSVNIENIRTGIHSFIF
jgi:hypothetical protein